MPQFATPVLLAVLLAATRIPVAAADSMSVKLWPDGPPGAKANPGYREAYQPGQPDPARPKIFRVSDPTLEIFLPPKAKATGAAVVICPGGGYAFLAYSHEGIKVAEWLNEIGVVGAVLKYRLPSDEIMRDKSIGPLQDVQEAIRTVRRHSAAWGVAPTKIGVLGFSAGGHLAGIASTLYAEKVYSPIDATSARPDFSVLVYGVLSFVPGISEGSTCTALLGADPTLEQRQRFSSELHVDARTPPAFLIHSQDDPAVSVEHSVRYFQALKSHGVGGELHIYQTGGHAYGLGISPGSPSQWPDELRRWLRSNGW